MGDSEEHNTSDKGQEIVQKDVGELEFEADKGEIGETEQQQCEVDRSVLQKLEVTEHVKIFMPTELKIEIMNMFEPLLKVILKKLLRH